MNNWTYSKHRATLKRDDEFFAIVTPDGRKSLSDERARELVDVLNLAESFLEVLPEALDLAEKHGKDELAGKLRLALQANAKQEEETQGAWASR